MARTYSRNAGPVIGWGTMPFEEGAKPYTRWTVGGQPVGGSIELPDAAVQGGAPPHWCGYLSTPDVKATAARARELGATIMAEEDIPNVGSIAIIADPQGAIFGAYQPGNMIPGHDGARRVGEFSWHELMTTDWEAAWRFYSELFGWEDAGRMEMGPMGTYQMHGRAGVPLGGIMNCPPDVPVGWIYYVRVADLDAACAETRTRGGEIVNEPMEVPGGDRIAHCRDPQGAFFAMHEPKSV